MDGVKSIKLLLENIGEYPNFRLRKDFLNNMSTDPKEKIDKF